MRTYVCFALAFGFATLAAAQSGDFAITGAKVFTGNGQMLDGATVVVKGGKIESVSSAPAPAGLSIVDAKGKFLYPGFIDAYSTRNQKSAPEATQDGKPDLNTSAPPYMWIGNRKGVYSEFGAAENLDFDKDTSAWESGITTSLFVPSKGCIRGAGAIVNLLPSTEKTRVIQPTFGFGLSYRNGAGDGYPSNILGVIALLRQVLSDAKSLSDGAELSKPGDKAPWLKSLQVLSPLVTGKKPGIFEVNMDREIDRSFKIANEFGISTVIAGGRDAYKLIPLIKEKNAPVVYAVDNLTEPSVEPDKASTPPADVTPLEFKKERHAKWEEQMTGPGLLAKGGVRMAFSAGTSVSQYLDNVRKFMKFGLSKDDALKAMTVNAAEMLGVSDQIGSIEPGKQANLVLMTGDFAETSSKVERVWITGKAVFEPKGATK